MSEQDKATTDDREEHGKRLALLSRLSPRALFWFVTTGAVAIAGPLAFAASVIVFRAAHLQILPAVLLAGVIIAGIVGFTVTRMTGHVARHERLERNATVDELTGSPNKRVVLERLELEIDRFARLGTPLSAVLVDIDHLERINDLHGHQAGDAVVRDVFARIERTLRAHDFAGRYGGDEFVMALPGTDAEEGAAIAERLRESVEESTAMNTPRVTISLGVAQIEEGMNAEDLIKRADKALYRAKQRGRNRTVTYPPRV
jgi:diguanylate cyclase (GGDEF)-like protein